MLAVHDAHHPRAQFGPGIAARALLVLLQKREAAAARRARQEPGHVRQELERRELVVHLEALRRLALAAANRDPFDRSAVPGRKIV